MPGQRDSLRKSQKYQPPEVNCSVKGTPLELFHTGATIQLYEERGQEQVLS